MNDSMAKTGAIDPVCGMSVDRDHATASGLTTELDGQTYYFCGKGCKLDFQDDPQRFLDPTFKPSM